MHLTTILTPLLALASFTTAAPSILPHTIVLTFEKNLGDMRSSPTRSDVSIQVNKLTLLGGIQASTIYITSATPDLDINRIECRTYKDAEGFAIGSAPFTVKNPARLSTNVVDVTSVLCYVVWG
jgi:hypothetical protein